MKSKMQKKDGRCYLCMKLHGSERIHTTLHEHHIFGGPNRSLSEAEGAKSVSLPGAPYQRAGGCT